MKKIIAAAAAALASAADIITPEKPGAYIKAEPGAGVKRAAERLRAHRKAQAERVKDAPKPQAKWHRGLGLPVSKRMQARADAGIA